MWRWGSRGVGVGCGVEISCTFAQKKSKWQDLGQWHTVKSARIADRKKQMDAVLIEVCRGEEFAPSARRHSVQILSRPKGYNPNQANVRTVKVKKPEEMG
jgi:hypothetical protein